MHRLRSGGEWVYVFGTAGGICQSMRENVTKATLFNKNLELDDPSQYLKTVM